MDIIKIISEELKVRPNQVEAAVKLIDEGNTIPFIARYRKDVTDNLNDEQLRNLDERLTYLRNLEERKAAVIDSITEQEKMTPELLKKIEEATTLVEVEDLYRPYKPKRRTRAMIAKEKGLEPLALDIMKQKLDIDAKEAAKAYISEEKEVANEEEALNGAMDIIAEAVSDDANYRTYIRKLTFREGILISKAKDEEAESVYENYYDFTSTLDKLSGYQILAINRGEKEKFLTVKIEPPKDKAVRYLMNHVKKKDNPNTDSYIDLALEDSYDRLISPSIEREIRSELTETAEDGAITVFMKNLRQLLMQPPIAGKVVLGWDPAFRTGCKLAVVDETGKVLDTVVIYPTAPQNKVKEAKKTLKSLVDKYGISLISVGNGTASRESEQVIVDFISEMDKPLQYIIVNEAGASVYSASKLATEEFPEFDVGQRSAASIARRLQDPLAELVKIDPKAISVGQYQHDMNQKHLSTALDGVVEDCVNQVGVDLNTASAPLLERVSGINKTIAKNIVTFREENGKFTNRKQLSKVPKLGPKAFEQCAGFMRIAGGDNPLDNTSVHPESYNVADKLLEVAGIDKSEISGGVKDLKKRFKDTKKLASELEVGVHTLTDIINELEKPGRDPRSDMPKPILRTDVLTMEDLREGEILKGTVRNVIDFGAFVDIGVHQDGLVHISQLTNKKYVKHPLEVVSVGDVVEVKVLSVDIKKKRISLTMIL